MLGTHVIKAAILGKGPTASTSLISENKLFIHITYHVTNYHLMSHTTTS